MLLSAAAEWNNHKKTTKTKKKKTKLRIMKVGGEKIKPLVKQPDARGCSSSNGQWPCPGLDRLIIYTAVSGLRHMSAGRTQRGSPNTNQRNLIWLRNSWEGSREQDGKQTQHLFWGGKSSSFETELTRGWVWYPFIGVWLLILSAFGFYAWFLDD